MEATESAADLPAGWLRQVISDIHDELTHRLAHQARERFVREPEREQITGLSKAAWWRLEQGGRAPRRLRIDTRTIAWRLSDLDRWVALTARGEHWTANA